MVEIALVLVIGAQMVFIGYQMRQVDRLTDKVMAKDYNEYKQLEKPTIIEDMPKHKPMSWADEVATDED